MFSQGIKLLIYLMLVTCNRFHEMFPGALSTSILIDQIKVRTFDPVCGRGENQMDGTIYVTTGRNGRRDLGHAEDFLNCQTYRRFYLV
jgi:hypothetical protein